MLSAGTTGALQAIDPPGRAELFEQLRRHFSDPRSKILR
jgi:hypothetical protein